MRSEGWEPPSKESISRPPEPVLEESVEIWREVGDKVGLAEALSQIGSVAHAQKDYERAAVLHGESLKLFRQVGFKGNVTDQLIFLGFTLQRQGDNAKAEQFLKEGLLLAQELESFQQPQPAWSASGAWLVVKTSPGGPRAYLGRRVNLKISGFGYVCLASTHG